MKTPRIWHRCWLLAGVALLSAAGAQPVAAQAEAKPEPGLKKIDDRVAKAVESTDQKATSFVIGAETFELYNYDDNGQLRFKLGDDLVLETLEAKGEIVFKSARASLHCNDLEYSIKAGEMEASGIGKQAIIIQQGMRASADRVRYLPDQGITQLIGNASVMQETETDVTEVFGDRIERTQDADGASTIVVQVAPRMKRYPQPDAPKTTEKTATPPPPETAIPAGAAGAKSQAAAIEMGMGDTVDLTADAAKGEFFLSITTDGQLEQFSARNKVQLKSDKLTILCHLLELMQSGDIMQATGLDGAPVDIRQGDIHAVCHKFVRDNKLRRSKLTGNPSIKKRAGQENKSQIDSAAKTIELHEAEDGTVDIFLNGQSSIQSRQQSTTPAAADAATTQPKAIKSPNEIPEKITIQEE